MLSFYTPGKGRIETVKAGETLPAEVNWIDALRPTGEEIAFLRRALGIQVPTLQTLSEIESSSKFRKEEDWLYLSVPVIYEKEGFLPALTPLGFAMSKNVLLTVRFKSLKVLDQLQDNLFRSPVEAGGPGALIGVLESLVEQVADVLEKTGNDLDGLSEEIFGAPGGASGHHRPRDDNHRLRVVMRKIGRYGDLTSKLDDLLLGMARLLPFVAANAAPDLNQGLRAKLKSLQRDIASLNDYVTHLTNQIQFLLDATLGLTNIEQNNIFRILTVVSVVGIPPTFFASMWGMNFKNIPEYDWAFGYQFGLIVIALSAIVPFIWFKWRGWW
ncbi:MAG TPA: magnesium transporter CorA family protein [Methylocella sp.]|nr:magnesium transporter CorA family protein [Methylocella sp.]